MSKILFTRMLDEAARATLEAAHLEVSEANFLRQTPSVSDDFRQQIRHDAAQNLIFTSQNAVRYFFQTLDNQRLRLPIGTRTFSASGATKTALSERGYSPTLSADTARQLASGILKRGDVRSATFVCGNLRLPNLPDLLQKGGVKVQELIIYRTEFTPQSIRSAFDAVVFFSPSAVDSFLLDNKLPPETTIFTLGKTTAAYLKKKIRASNVTVSPRPEIEALMNLIIEKYKK